jgi:hypothetical protein
MTWRAISAWPYWKGVMAGKKGKEREMKRVLMKVEPRHPPQENNLCVDSDDVT